MDSHSQPGESACQCQSVVFLPLCSEGVVHMYDGRIWIWHIKESALMSPRDPNGHHMWAVRAVVPG